MRMLAVLFVVAVAQPVSAQGRMPIQVDGRPRGEVSIQTRAERAALRAQVFQTFMDRATDRLGLDASARARLEQVLRQNETRRHDMGRQSAQARRDIQAGLQNNASDAELARLLDKLDELRVRELDVWRVEQAELARVLTSRQRAQLIGLRAELFERVQQMGRQKWSARPGNPNEGPPQR